MFKEFLAIIGKVAPEELAVHWVLQDYRACKTTVIYNWLAYCPRFHLRFALASASWVHRVE